MFQLPIIKKKILTEQERKESKKGKIKMLIKKKIAKKNYTK